MAGVLELIIASWKESRQEKRRPVGSPRLYSEDEQQSVRFQIPDYARPCDGFTLLHYICYLFTLKFSRFRSRMHPGFLWFSGFCRNNFPSV